MKRDNKQNKKRANLLEAYQCHCGWWHVGHNKFKTARQRRFAVSA